MADLELLAYLQSFITENRKATFEKVLANRTRHFTVILEDIYQPHNTSAVVRSCDVFGVQDVYTIENKYKSYVSNQVAKGAEKWTTRHRFNTLQHNTQDCLNALRGKGYQIIATTPHNDSCYVSDFDVSKKSALVFGVEKEGVSDDIMNQADGYLKIPMVGFTESLNISVAVAIILQDITDRLRKSDVKWQLTEEEKNILRIEWTKNSIGSIEQIINRFNADKNR